MNAFKLKEKRFRPRKALTGLLPGRLVRAAGGEGVSCKPVDISEHGIGVISEDVLKVDDTLILESKSKKIELVVTYSRKDFGKHNLVRYGLSCIDQSINLELEFQEAGCLK
ncbi:MAG: hypothetical protein HRU19_06125 [Pseudobacteriovorax sp.]|nr:hypothetical protein [Pseudobacteriovorax sp.]